MAFTPRQTADEQLNRIQQDIAAEFVRLGRIVDNSQIPTVFVESRAAQVTDVVLVFAGPTGQTLTLAPAHMPTANRSRQLVVFNRSANTLTIQAPGSETIDGAASITLATNRVALVIADGQSAHLSMS